MKVTKDMLIADIINEDRGSAAVLMQMGMHCVGCLMAHNENLEDACSVHGIDVDAVVDALNDYFALNGKAE